MILRSLLAAVAFALFSLLPVRPLQRVWTGVMVGLSPERTLSSYEGDPVYSRVFPDNRKYFSGFMRFRITPLCTMLNVAAAMIPFVVTRRSIGHVLWRSLAVVVFVSLLNGGRLLLMDVLHARDVPHWLAHGVPLWLLAGGCIVGVFAWRSREHVRSRFTKAATHR